jgi:hypothetical protein
MIPFLVLDKPNGLSIINKAVTSPATHFGIMTHIRVSERFISDCDALRRELKRRFGSKLRFIVDSGAFIKNHTPITETELFSRYERMKASHGIVNDVLGDSRRTIANCSKAMREYRKSRHTFKLVGVTQGQCVDEYLTCYKALAGMGYRHIAVGGLLQKKPTSIRFTQVKNTKFMQQVLRAIRSEFNPDWLYVLGAYHPQRHELFQELGVWGSDYKGWLFRYPSIFEGFLTLSAVASESFLTAREIKKIERARAMIKKYRLCDDHTRAVIRKKIEAFHANLWRSEPVIKLLSLGDLQSKEYRLLQAVFWQSTTERREAGILHHLRTTVFPSLTAKG